MSAPAVDLRRRHLVFGWWSLLVFLVLGMTLEALHGFKLRWYLDVANETRRLMLTLGHAHGTLLALVHLAFAASQDAPAVGPVHAGRGAALASRALVGASLLVPGGFLLGGLWVYDGDPGLGVLLVPLGALLLFAAVARQAWSVTRRR